MNSSSGLVRALSLIKTKRDGGVLTSDAIQWFLDGCVAGTIPDYQIAALLMAIFFRGMTREETVHFTLAMRDSGAVLKFPKRDPRPVVDKHSSGGVGDKVSLPLVPLLMALGFRVPMISGRGLGLTGGTLDKLESIPGFQVRLTPDEIVSLVQSHGAVICSQTSALVPADKRLYALRDVTATVPSLPLITTSILSKKLAEGISALILDIKYGAAAFMEERRKARALARTMVEIAGHCGVRTRALLTPMNEPTGRAVGHWLEIKESMACLQGRGPDDLVDLTIECAAHLLVLSGREQDMAAARSRARQCLASQEPMNSARKLFAAQGADLAAFDSKLAQDHMAKVVVECRSARSGWVKHCDALCVANLLRDLGGCRDTLESHLDLNAGFDRLARRGDYVHKGGLLGRVHADNQRAANSAALRLPRAFTLGMSRPRHLPVVSEILDETGR